VNEFELQHALNHHDALVTRCACGELPFEAFVADYDNFFVRWALDGHESCSAEQAMLHHYAARIRVHQRIWEEVLCCLTSEELACAPASRAAAFIGPRAALARLRDIAASVLLVEPTGGRL